MTTYSEVLAAVVALNRPEAKNAAMVYQVFEDGEITLQKGGDLLWQRTLHCVATGKPHGVILHVASMPNQMCSAPHGYIFCKDRDDAEKARALIFSLDA